MKNDCQEIFWIIERKSVTPYILSYQRSQKFEEIKDPPVFAYSTFNWAFQTGSYIRPRFIKSYIFPLSQVRGKPLTTNRRTSKKRKIQKTQ